MRFFRWDIPIFFTSLEEEILLSLAYFKVGFKCRKSLEDIAGEIAEENFGRVSRMFRKALRHEMPLAKYLKGYAEEASNILLKEFITAILSEPKQFQKLYVHITTSIQNNQKPFYEDLSRRVDALGNWFLMMPLLPMAVVIMDLINKTFAEIPPEAGLNFPQTMFSDGLKITVIIVGAITVCIVIMMPKVKIR